MRLILGTITVFTIAVNSAFALTTDYDQFSERRCERLQQPDRIADQHDDGRRRHQRGDGDELAASTVTLPTIRVLQQQMSSRQISQA